MFYKIMCLVNTLEKASTGRRPDIFMRLSHAPGKSRLPVRLIMSSFTPLSELCLGDASASAFPFPPPCACLRGKSTPFPLETPPKSVSPGEASSASVGAGSLSEFPHFFQALESIVEVTQLRALVQLVLPTVSCMS